MNENKMKISGLAITIIVLLLLSCCCVFTIATGLGGYWLYQNLPGEVLDTIQPILDDQLIPDQILEPTPTPGEINRIPSSDISTETLLTLENEIVPINDPLELACRLGGKCNIPTELLSGPYKVGAKQQFWLTNTDNVESFQIDASLEYITDHAYFWVEDGVEFDMTEAKDLVDEFEKKMYPTNREFFGSEANPGIDGDPHIYIVYGRGIGSSVAGYFSSPDAYHPLAHEYSNAHEMFVFNADNSPLSDMYTYGVLAHEFQHMIHFVKDRNEESWLNEGFSEVAVLLNDYYRGGADTLYINEPDMQLNDWGPNPGTNGPHYGASFLFFSYFLDRFGEDATKSLVQDQQNGFESIDNVLNTIKATDPLTNAPILADDVFMDWTVTNYLLNSDVGDGRYDYQTYKYATNVENVNLLNECPTEINGTVHQYGADYITIKCGGEYTLRFEGSTATTLLPEDPYSGAHAFWSNKGDESNMTLTREFDFTNSTGELTLDFQTWYDLEQDYDYLFLETSTDGGATWQIITTPSGTDEDPSGNSYGWGYNGSSNGWFNEKVDISSLAGKKALIRFEYVTDAAVNGEGFMIDDISIPQIDYSTDLETDEGGWIGEGFINIENILPQTFRLMLVNEDGKTEVKNITLEAEQTAELKLDLSNATLIVSGTTRHTRSLANYRLIIK